MRSQGRYLLVGEMKQAAERNVNTKVVGALLGQRCMKVTDDRTEGMVSHYPSHTLPLLFCATVLLQGKGAGSV